jgi:KaiC/GvpD/RAD55 family RecA-like ATPase
MTDIDRIKSGIPGLDTMVGGGIPRQSVLGVSGPPGVGKSIFALQFILQGARNNEKSLYINLEEPLINIAKTVSAFSFSKEFSEYEHKKLISNVHMNYEDFEIAYSDLFRQIEKDTYIKRLVIDSFNCFFTYLRLEKQFIKKGYETRKILSSAFSLFRRKDMTTLLVLEKEGGHSTDFGHYVEYMVDGLIYLDYISLGNIERRIFVPKMRWTKQYDSSLPFDITKKGIIISKEGEDGSKLE